MGSATLPTPGNPFAVASAADAGRGVDTEACQPARGAAVLRDAAVGDVAGAGAPLPVLLLAAGRTAAAAAGGGSKNEGSFAVAASRWM